MTTKEELTKAKETIKQYEKEQIRLSIIKDHSCCSKCSVTLPNRWVTQANYIKLDIGIACCSTEALFGRGDKIGFNHPAIEEGSSYQRLLIESKKDNDYRLCEDCHDMFVKQVGTFLKEDYLYEKQ